MIEKFNSTTNFENIINPITYRQNRTVLSSDRLNDQLDMLVFQKISNE